MENNLIIENKNTFRYFPFKTNIQALIVLVFIALAYYINSIQNEVALDDGINIQQNNYVLKGIKGIPEILTNDTYASFYKRMNADPQLNGGRFRPLTTITFALEQELIGTYRTGHYLFTADLNNNGKLDEEKVEFINSNGDKETNFEYNDFIDLNNDGKVQQNECYMCWDANHNFKNDTNEDLNNDGVFNEIDCEVAGSNFRHFNNVLIFVALIIMLFIFLTKFVFYDRPDFSFLSTLLFLIHPLNTETVAVISRRDEMLSLFFILFSLYFSFQYIKINSRKNLVLACLGMLLALLSKEYALMLIVLIPIGIRVFLKEVFIKTHLLISVIIFIVGYVLLLAFKPLNLSSIGINYFLLGFSALFILGISSIFILRSKFKSSHSSFLMLSLFGTSLFYLLMRFNSIDLQFNEQDNEVLNNAYLYATDEERFCTKISIFLYYLKLLIFPKTLVCDYSYNVIAFKHFTSWEFIFSFVLNLIVIIIGVYYVIKKHVIGFAIAFYYLFLLIVSNLVFFIGTTMNEHFIFHSTVGFTIAISWLISKGMESIRTSEATKNYLLIVPLILIIITSGIKVYERNKDWKNDITLFLHDVKDAPNSVICLGNAGARWIDLSDSKEITGIALPGQNKDQFNDYNGNLNISDEEIKAGGYKDKREAAIHKGIKYLIKAVEIHPKYINGYLNLGLASYKLDDHLKAIYYWKMAEALYPNNPYLLNYYQVAGAGYFEKGKDFFNEGNYIDAIKEYQKCIVINNKKEALIEVARSYFNLKQFNSAKIYCNKVLKTDPNNAVAKNLIDQIENETTN